MTWRSANFSGLLNRSDGIVSSPAGRPILGGSLDERWTSSPSQRDMKSEEVAVTEANGFPVAWVAI